MILYPICLKRELNKYCFYIIKNMMTRKKGSFSVLDRMSSFTFIYHWSIGQSIYITIGNLNTAHAVRPVNYFFSLLQFSACWCVYEQDTQPQIVPKEQSNTYRCLTVRQCTHTAVYLYPRYTLTSLKGLNIKSLPQSFVCIMLFPPPSIEHITSCRWWHI